METTLHRDLKTFYAGKKARLEVSLGDYRIDAVLGNKLIEIQHGSLCAIRDKIRSLLDDHQVLVVKPIVTTKRLVKQASKDGPIVSRRMSPKRGTRLSLFDELVYFTQVFPHRRLTLEILLVQIEEWRYPGHGRRRRWRKNDYQVQDQKLLTIEEAYRLKTAVDIGRFVDCPLPKPFHTGHLAEGLDIDRWTAQRIAYCLRKIGTIRQVGKKRNAWLYQFTQRRRSLKPIRVSESDSRFTRVA